MLPKSEKTKVSKFWKTHSPFDVIILGYFAGMTVWRNHLAGNAASVGNFAEAAYMTSWAGQSLTFFLIYLVIVAVIGQGKYDRSKG